MDLLQALLLACVQGLTEFLPVSSSAHLILVPKLLGWPDQGLVFDVAVHVGTLFAVLSYFRRDLLAMGKDLLQGNDSTERRLALQIALATLPVAIVGLLAHHWIETFLRSPLFIAGTTFIFALLLGWADWRGAKNRDLGSIRWTDVCWISFAQVLALMPGTSRAGITLTAACLCGLTRQAAARFSFLLSIPVITLAGGHAIWTLKATPIIPWLPLLTGIVTAFLTAYWCIGLFLRWIERIGLAPFVAYRLILSMLLVWTFW